MGETVIPTRLLDVYVEFVCPTRTVAFSGIEGIRAAEESPRPLKEALSPIDLHPYVLDLARGRRHTHKMICWTYNLELSAASVRNALSGLEPFYVISVRKKTRNLPVLQRRRRVVSLPACRCKKFPCKHTPTTSWSDHLAECKREDAAIRQRRSRVTHNRIGAGRAKS